MKKDRTKPGAYIKINGVVIRSMIYPKVEGKRFIITDDGVILILNTRTGTLTTAVGVAEIEMDSMDATSQYATRVILDEQTERLSVLSKTTKFLSAVANVMKYASQPIDGVDSMSEVRSMLHPGQEDDGNPLS